MAIDFQTSVAARTLWQEARGEPIDGQRAVAHVMLNRMKDGRWGLTLAEVCFSEFHGIFQFSGWDRNDKNRVLALRLPDDDRELVQLAAVIQAVIDGDPDLTGGATHYYSKNVPAPAWVKDASFCGQFGRQLFYRGVK